MCETAERTTEPDPMVHWPHGSFERIMMVHLKEPLNLTPWFRMLMNKGGQFCPPLENLYIIRQSLAYFPFFPYIALSSVLGFNVALPGFQPAGVTSYLLIFLQVGSFDLSYGLGYISSHRR